MENLCNNRIVYSQFVARDVVMMLELFSNAGIVSRDRDSSVLNNLFVETRLEKKDEFNHDKKN